MTKESKFILLITTLLSIIFLVGFGWGTATLDDFREEVRTLLTDTDNNFIYSEKEFATTLEKYPGVDTLALYNRLETEDIEYLDYGAFAPVPGIEGTKSLDIQSGEIGMCTSMTPQGVTVAKDYLITSAYDHDKHHNSVLYIQDLGTHELIKTIVLDGKPHVGGITYDSDNDRIWVCGHKNKKAEVFSIDLEKMLKYDLEKEKAPIEYVQRVMLGEITRASYITYDNRSIYVGFFNPSGFGSVQRYEIDEDGILIGDEIVDKVTNELNILGNAITGQETLEKIQGMAIYDKYTILSQSYGPKSSKMYIFENDKNRTMFKKEEAIAEFNMPAHLEQISEHDGRLYMIFESSSRAYRNKSDDVIDRVLSIDIRGFVKLMLENEYEK